MASQIRRVTIDEEGGYGPVKRRQKENDPNARRVPNAPKILKIMIQSTMTSKDIEPEDYLGGIAELLFLTIVGSYIITFINDKVTGLNRLSDNPIKNMVGYNNPCAFWDNPPALYFASFMFCPMVFLGLRYASDDSVRAKLTRGVNTKAGCCGCINLIYALSQCMIMGIFIVRPKIAPPLSLDGNSTLSPAEVQEMHWYMRVHSACFLQFVPILCVTMSANYFEGYLSGNPKSKPTAAGWAVLSFYICATILETVFATYAIMFYEGTYQQTADYEMYFKVPRSFMMIVDYCWFLSLPLAASFQPAAPNLIYRVRLEDSWAAYENDDVDEWDEEDEEHADTHCATALCRVYATMLIVWSWVIPIFAFVLYCAGPGHPKTLRWEILLGIGIGAPILITCILWIPIHCDTPDDDYRSGCCGSFSVNGASFNFCNYTKRLLDFAKGAAKDDFRPAYGQWFVDQCDDDDDQVGVRFGGNTEMIYGWQAVKERLESMGERAADDTMKRESELALSVMNNLMWPEAGKFALGYDKDHHAFVRPYLASVFDLGEGTTWTAQMLQEEFRKHFSSISVLDHNLVSRNMTDVTNPAKSKTIVTQMCLKVLHKVAFGVKISSDDASELAALQTTQLLPAVCPASVTRTFWMWSIVAGPARNVCVKWIRRYKVLIQKKWPELDGADDDRLNLLASAFLDTMTQAGGRSVPLAIDLTLGYMLSINSPDSLDDVDFQQPGNIRKLMMECMRYHPPVTVIPTWVQSEDDGEWKHQLICLDRACADPEVFPDPDEFRLDRDPRCSMAWADFAFVDGQKDHPHSHGCPGKELSINMTVAFVQAYQAAGPWELQTDDIKINFYGTKGFKCTKINIPEHGGIGRRSTVAHKWKPPPDA